MCRCDKLPRHINLVLIFSSVKLFHNNFYAAQIKCCTTRCWFLDSSYALAAFFIQDSSSICPFSYALGLVLSGKNQINSGCAKSEWKLNSTENWNNNLRPGRRVCFIFSVDKKLLSLRSYDSQLSIQDWGSRPRLHNTFCLCSQWWYALLRSNKDSAKFPVIYGFTGKNCLGYECRT